MMNSFALGMTKLECLVHDNNDKETRVDLPQSERGDREETQLKTAHQEIDGTQPHNSSMVPKYTKPRSMQILTVFSGGGNWVLLPLVYQYAKMQSAALTTPGGKYTKAVSLSTTTRKKAASLLIANRSSLRLMTYFQSYWKASGTIKNESLERSCPGNLQGDHWECGGKQRRLETKQIIIK